MHPAYDELQQIITVLTFLLVIVVAIALGRSPDPHPECNVLHDKLSHAERVRTETARHAFHHPGYPARDCTLCAPVEPK